MLIALFCTGASLYAQSSEKDKATIKWIDSSNKKSDHAIMSKDTVTLLGLYAKDFLFTHSGGNIDTKDSWIKSIKNADRHYISRTHDSVQAELHSNVVIVKGRLLIERQDKDKTAQYGIMYVRIYAFSFVPVALPEWLFHFSGSHSLLVVTSALWPSTVILK